MPEMTMYEVWSNISRRLTEHEREHGYTDDDLQADVMVFGALRALGEKDGE